MLRIKQSKKITLLLVAVIYSITTWSIVAQVTPDQWDLDRCISYALEKNLSVNISKLKINTGKTDVMQARSQRLPNLNASASQTLTNSNSPNGDKNISELSYGGNFGINSGITVYNGGIINNDIAKSNLAHDLAILNLETATNNITISVTQAYLNALYSKENLDYFTQVVAASERQLTRAKALHQAGSIARRDVAEIEAQFANDKYSMVNASNNLVIQITILKQILEIPVEEEFSLHFPGAGLKVVLDPLPSRENAFESALNFRPEVKGSLVQLEMARLDLKSARAGFLPTIGLSASLTSNYNDRSIKAYSTQISDNFMQSVGLNLSVPIFNRNVTKANVSRGKINIESAELTVSNIRNKLLQEVEKIYEDTRAAQLRFDAAQAQEKASVESYKLAEEQYSIGMLNAFELLQSKNNHLNAGRELIQAKYTTILYRKILDFYMGIPITIN